MESSELIAILREVREKVRARHPQGTAPGQIPLPDLLPLVHARDAALGKVASIGTVNPRPAGVVNAVIQASKRLVARILGWHVREQVTFNRQLVECINNTIEALNENNCAINQLAGLVADLSKHWAAWRREWEEKLEQTEVQFLRSVAEQHAAFLEQGRRQAADFTKLLEKTAEQIRTESERLIHTELRLVRQRTALAPALAPPAKMADRCPASFDYGRFTERFRGTEEYVRTGQSVYLPYFVGRKNVLDLGCGRGEFLEMMRSAGVGSRGIDLNPECVARCRQKGLTAEAADLFAYMNEQPEATFDGIFCAQVVEHLPPERVPEMIRLAASRLAVGGVLAIETPNPECLAIFATHFYLDPGHARPIPYPLLVFYLEEFGIGRIEVRQLSPAADTVPSLASLPAEFREAFFGGLDYVVIGRKL